MTKAGKRLIAAAHEANAIAKGEKEAASFFVPADVDVRKIRRSVGLSQENFAAEFCFSVSQVRDWEQGRSRPANRHPQSIPRRTGRPMTDPDDEKPSAPRVFLIVTYHEESGTLNIADMSTPDDLKAEILDALIDVLGDDCGESEIFH